MKSLGALGPRKFKTIDRVSTRSLDGARAEIKSHLMVVESTLSVDANALELALDLQLRADNGHNPEVQTKLQLALDKPIALGKTTSASGSDNAGADLRTLRRACTAGRVVKARDDLRSRAPAELEALYVQHERGLYNVAYRYTWSAEDARDVVHDAFVRMWRRRASIDWPRAAGLAYRTVLGLASIAGAATRSAGSSARASTPSRCRSRPTSCSPRRATTPPFAAASIDCPKRCGARS